MGICASCLGLNRHPSQDIDETDPLLDDPPVDYGAADADGGLDEEELRRERGELDRITNAATDNMIDVHQHDAAEMERAAGSQRRSRMYDEPKEQEEGNDDDEEEDEEEAAWLQSVQASNLTDVQGMRAGGLVLDANQLRGEHSRATKALKANVGA